MSGFPYDRDTPTEAGEARHDACCATCGHRFENGDVFIEDTASGFTGTDTDPTVDGLMADLFGGSDGKILLCENCIQTGGKYVARRFGGREGRHAD